MAVGGGLGEQHNVPLRVFPPAEETGIHVYMHCLCGRGSRSGEMERDRGRKD